MSQVQNGKMRGVFSFQLAVQKACQVSDLEKLFPEQFKTVKTFFFYVTGLLLSLQSGFERSLVFSASASLKNRYISHGNLVSQQAR